MRVLVTGGAGFIGSHLVDALVDRGYDVIIVDDLSSGNNINKGAEFFKRNINSDLTDIFEKGIDYVFHLAAQIDLRSSLEFPVRDAETNVLGSLNVIECCLRYKVRKIIFSSSAAVYSGDCEIPINEDSEVNPWTPYGLGKLTIEKYLEIFKREFGLDYAVLRYSNVYGPRQRSDGEGGVMSIFINSALKGGDVKIFGDGSQTRDFIFVKDVVSANLFCVDNNLGGVFNVSTGKEVSVNGLAEAVRRETNSISELVYFKEKDPGVLRSCLSYDKLKSFGWEIKYSFEEGLKESVKWFKLFNN